jgi:predicted TIM-barrel fold metal-dependent hydrolase
VTRIDAHAHLIPDAYRAELERRGFSRYPLPPASPEDLLSFMGRWGIDAAVASLSPPGVFFGDAGLASELARLCNEEMAAAVAAHPERLAGLAVLPLPDLDAAIAELGYALDQLGLDGVALLSNVAGTYLGDPAWAPLFDELDRRGAYVFVHPIEPATPGPMPAVPVWVQEFPFDTTRAAVDLIYSGTLERCQRIRLQLAHMGGSAPFLAHRIAELAARDPARRELAPAGAVAYLSRLFYDTGLANNAIALAATRELAGLERIVFGSDWPYAAMPEAGEDPAPDLGGLRLAPQERALLDGENARALVPRLLAAAERSAEA